MKYAAARFVTSYARRRFSNQPKTPLRLAWFERGDFAQEGAQGGFGRARFELDACEFAAGDCALDFVDDEGFACARVRDHLPDFGQRVCGRKLRGECCGGAGVGGDKVREVGWAKVDGRIDVAVARVELLLGVAAAPCMR